MKKVFLFLAALLTATVMNLQAEDITSWTIAGDQAMMGSHWDPKDTNNDMELKGGVYKLVKTAYLTEGGFDYKACANHAWGVKEVPSSTNQTLQIDDDGDYEIIFTLDAAGTTLTATAALPTPEIKEIQITGDRVVGSTLTITPICSGFEPDWDSGMYEYQQAGESESSKFDLPYFTPTKAGNCRFSVKVMNMTHSQTYSKDTTIYIAAPAEPDMHDFLYFVGLNGNDTVRLNKVGSTDLANLTATFEYSTDRKTWTEYTWDATDSKTGAAIELKTAGDTVFFRAKGTKGLNATMSYSSTTYFQFAFGKDDSIAAGGNTMSLYDATCEQDSMTASGFYDLFLKASQLVSAPKLPATQLAEFCYSNIFSSCTALTTAPALPATTLTKGCYSSMFYRCSSLTKAPELNATTLAETCYKYMFRNCSSLEVDTCTGSCDGVMFEPTTTGDEPTSWNQQMFNGCQGDAKYTATYGIKLNGHYCIKDGLDYLHFVGLNGNDTVRLNKYAMSDNFITELTATFEYSKDRKTWTAYDTWGTYGDPVAKTALGAAIALNQGDTVFFRAKGTKGENATMSNYNSYFNFAFGADDQIAAGGKIMSLYDALCGQTTMTRYGFCYLFQNAKQLVSAPKLPATTMAENCYDCMFQNCTSLTTAPALPATTLVSYCYNAMFRDCASLTQIPELKATTLASNCYVEMFRGCSSLQVDTCTGSCDGVEFNPTTIGDEPPSWKTNMFVDCKGDAKYTATYGVKLNGHYCIKAYNPCDEMKTPDSPTIGSLKAQPIVIAGLPIDVEASILELTEEYAKSAAVDTKKIDTIWCEVKYPGDAYKPITNQDTVPLNVGQKDINIRAVAVTECNDTLRGLSAKFKAQFYESVKKGQFATGDEEGFVMNEDVETTVSPAGTISDGQLSFTGTLVIKGNGSLIRGIKVVYEDAYIQCEKKDIPQEGSLFTLANPSPSCTLSIAVDAPQRIDGRKAAKPAAQITSLEVIYEVLSSDTLDYLHFVGLNGNDTVRLNKVAGQWMESELKATFEYSTNRINWTDYTWGSFAGNVAVGTPIALNQKDTVFFRAKGTDGKNTTMSCTNSGVYFQFVFGADDSISAGGNIMSLYDASCEPTTATTQYGFTCLFKNAYQLVSAPKLPAKKLAMSCYTAMFDACTSLREAPELPADSFPNGACYNAMFQGCTSLTTAPALPADSLPMYCYQSMFKGCTSLTTIPELKATKLARQCYSSMFQNCTSLQVDTCADDKCDGVKFNPINNSTRDISFWNISMFDGCHVNDSIQLGGHYCIKEYVPEPDMHDFLYFVGLNGNDTVRLDKFANKDLDKLTATFEFSKDRKTWTPYDTWATDTCPKYTYQGNPIALNQGDTVFFRAKGTNGLNATMSYYNVVYFTFAFGADDSIAAGGNIMSLYDAECKQDTMTAYGFYNLFKYAKQLVSAPKLPATKLAEYCYNSMFVGCTALTAAPELSAATLANYCYYYMFDRCTALTAAPALSATTLQVSCYEYMFTGCSALTSAPALPATTLQNSCYAGMFKGCTALTAAPELNATALASSCYGNMFANCTSLTAAPELKATTLVNNCYRNMFNGCTSLQVDTCADGSCDGVKFEPTTIGDEPANWNMDMFKDCKGDYTNVKLGGHYCIKGYVAVSITAEFDMQGHGEQVEPQTIASGSKFEKPEDPQAEGFAFGGWFQEATCDNAFDFDKAVTATQDSTITIYAKWTELKSVKKGQFATGDEDGFVMNEDIETTVSPAGTISDGQLNFSGTLVIKGNGSLIHGIKVVYEGGYMQCEGKDVPMDGSLFTLAKPALSCTLNLPDESPKRMISQEKALVTISSIEVIYEVLPSIEGIELVAVNTVYDGKNHNIQVNGTIEGDVVNYSTDSATWAQDTIKLKNVSETNIFVRIQRADHKDWGGKTTVTITPKQLTITEPTVADKVYNGHERFAAIAGTKSGVIGTDEANVSAVGIAGDKNVGQDKQVVVEYEVYGAAKNNYAAPVNDTVTASIMPDTLTVSGTTVANKVYDGTTTASVDAAGTLQGVIGTDDVSINGAIGTFADKNVGDDKDVTVSFTLKGADANNYEVLEGESMASITPRDLTLQSADLEKKYDGKALTAYSLTGGTTVTDLTAGQTNKGYVAGEEFNYTSFTGSQLVVGNSDNTFNFSDSETALAINYNVTKQYGKLTVTNPIVPQIEGMYEQWNIVLDQAELADTLMTYINGVILLEENVTWYVVKGDADTVNQVTGAVVDDVQASPATGFYHTEGKAMNDAYYCVVKVPEAEAIMGISYFQSNVVFIQTPAPTAPIRKMIKDNQLIIIRDGAMYNAQGARL